MKVSSKGDYGIRALIDLAQNEGRGPIPSGEIAGRQGIPESLIGQVLASLRLAGFVGSVRGAQGGHQLAMRPEEIQMDQVVEALDGPITPGACLENANPACSGSAAQIEMWELVQTQIKDVLSSRSLADLARAGVAATGRYSI
jgi:Rrf2 family cysteine metabolism transcriptional repressor